MLARILPRCMEAGYPLGKLHDKWTCQECGSRENDMAKPGFNSGMKCPPPAKGKNGPMDKGRSSGTKHFAPPLPTPNKPKQGGSGK